MTLTSLPHGLHARVPPETYHKRVPGLVSRGALMELARSPAHYQAWVRHEAKEPSSDALEFGSAFHTLLLEPDAFAKSYAVAPDFGDCRYKEAKAKKAAWEKEHGMQRAVGAGDHAAMLRMRDSILLHPIAGRIVDGKIEHTAVWTDSETGLLCKCRPDVFVEKHSTIVDVKTAADASPVGFRKSVYNHGYHLQRALYTAGMQAVGAEVSHFLFVVVEKAPPFAVAVYALDAMGEELGARDVRRLTNRMAECVASGVWPGYASGIQTIETPPWAA